MKQLTGRDKARVCLWDKDFNLLHSVEADTPGEALGQLFVTVDPADGAPRKGGRIASVTTIPSVGHPDA